MALSRSVLILLSSLTSALLGAGVAQYFHSPQASPTIGASNSETVEELQTRVRELESQNQLLAHQLQQRSTLTSQASGPQSGARQSEMRPVTEQQIMEEQAAANTETALQSSAEEFRTWLGQQTQNTPGFNLQSTMQKRFDKEAIDRDWASGEQSRIFNEFSTNPKLAEFALTNAECRSNSCQLTLAINDIEQANQMSLALAQALGDQTHPGQLIVTPDIKNNRAQVYLLRNNQSLIPN